MNPRPLGYEQCDVRLRCLGQSPVTVLTSTDLLGDVLWRLLCLPRLSLSRRVWFTNRLTEVVLDLLGEHLIRRYPRGRPDPFRSVRDLGLVSPGCPAGSGSSVGCSSVWLPAWLPPQPLASTTNGFKSVRGSRAITTATWLFSTRGCSSSKIIPRISRALPVTPS